MESEWLEGSRLGFPDVIRFVTRIITIVLCLVVSAFLTSAPAYARLKDGDRCVLNGEAEGVLGATGIAVRGKCVKTSAGAPAENAGPPTKVVDCGRPSSKDNGFWVKECGAPRACYDDVADPNHQHPEDAFATFVQAPDGSWLLQNVWCPTSSTPIPDTQAVREQALRLLPTVAIGSAWTHRALIHAQAILWADTPPDRTLPPVTVVGHRVQLRIHFEHAAWDYGDGATATTETPGRPYNAQTDPCQTAQCPGYQGHTYTRTGPATISLTVAWQAQFSLDNGTTWTDVDPAPLPGPATTRQLQLLQARGVLVRTPGT